MEDRAAAFSHSFLQSSQNINDLHWPAMRYNTQYNPVGQGEVLC
jgi:hypothetical protein